LLLLLKQVKYRKVILEETAQRKLRREVHKLKATTTLTLEQGKKIHKEFISCRRRSGDETSMDTRAEELDCIEFRALLLKLFPDDAVRMENAAECFFQAFDADSSGTLDIVEIIRGIALCCSRSIEDFVTNVFNVFDVDHSESLDKEEVQSMVSMSLLVLSSYHRSQYK